LKQTIISRNKGVITFWLSVTLATISIAILSSCSTRKVVIEEVKKDSLSQIYTKIETKEDIKIETKNDIVTNEFIITPLDTCKDIVVNGIKYKNVVLRHINTKDNSLHKEDIKVSKIEDKQQTTKVKENTKVKNIEKTSNPIGYILIIIIIYLVWQNRRWFLLV
jgi:sorbitol-specific phosphotransferase system component IIBC